MAPPASRRVVPTFLLVSLCIHIYQVVPVISALLNGLDKDLDSLGIRGLKFNMRWVLGAVAYHCFWSYFFFRR